jgi:hypothetical protein
VVAQEAEVLQAGLMERRQAPLATAPELGQTALDRLQSAPRQLALHRQAGQEPAVLLLSQAR